MHYGGCQGHVKVRSRSLTFDDLSSLLLGSYIFRLVFRADFEFSTHLNIYEVILAPSYNITKLSVLVDTYYGQLARRLLVDLT